MDSLETVNGIANRDNVTVGALYYVTLNSGMVLLFYSLLLLLVFVMDYSAIIWL